MLLLEYLAKRSADEPFSLGQFCRDRYGSQAEPMREFKRRVRASQSTDSGISCIA